MAGNCSRRSARGRPIDLRRFFARRALRIIPAYFVILAVYAFLPSWREYPEMSPLWKFVLSVQNIGLHGGTAFSHAWSLAVEDQFYFLLPLILILVSRWPRARFIMPCLIVLGGIGLRTFLARQNLVETGVSFRGFQTWIYYPTWTRPRSSRLRCCPGCDRKVPSAMVAPPDESCPWLLLPGLALIVYALYLGEGDYLTVAAAIWQFPLVALGMAALLVCAVSPRLFLRRVKIPGAAFIASIAYSAYLIQKLVIHFVSQFCVTHNIVLTSAAALSVVELCVYAVATILFVVVERPFLQLRHRVAPRPSRS